MTHVAMDKNTELTRLMLAHQAGVWRYLRALGCDPARADELTQDTFIAVIDSPFEDRGEAAAGAWLRTIARNLFLKSIRGRKRQAVVSLATQVDDLFASAAGDRNAEEWLDALRVCLEELDARLREALDVRYRDRKSPAEIGRALGITEGSVKNLLLRAKERVKDCVLRRVSP